MAKLSRPIRLALVAFLASYTPLWCPCAKHAFATPPTLAHEQASASSGKCLTCRRSSPDQSEKRSQPAEPCECGYHDLLIGANIDKDMTVWRGADDLVVLDTVASNTALALAPVVDVGLLANHDPPPVSLLSLRCAFLI